MDQAVIDKAVKIATKEALEGRPVERVIWNPPNSATSNPSGTFVVIPARAMSGSSLPPWEA